MCLLIFKTILLQKDAIFSSMGKACVNSNKAIVLWGFFLLPFFFGAVTFLNFDIGNYDTFSHYSSKAPLNRYPFI